MKAVNLIPPDDRVGGGGAGGRSAGGAYVLLGALAVLVLLAVSYTLTAKSVNDRRSELAKVEREAQVTEAKAASLANYTSFREMRRQRVATVKSIASSRFDWAHAMRELARTMPADVVLNSLRGTVRSGVPVTGGATIGLRGALPDLPAIEIAGCVPGQAEAAKMLVNLRRVDGVRRVSLQQSVKKANAAVGAPAAGGGATSVIAADCDWDFQAVVFYDAAKEIEVAPGAAAAGTEAGTPVSATTTTGAGR